MTGAAELRLVIARLEYAAELGEALAPENCRLLARVVRGVEADLAEMEEDAALDQAILESNVIPFPRRFRCVL